MPQRRESALMEQSNYFTNARYDYTATEKRILYRVLEQACDFRRKNLDWFKEHDGQYYAAKPVTMEMDVTAFMSDEAKEERGGRQDKLIYDAFESLKKKSLSVYQKKGSWSVGSIVNWAIRQEGKGTVRFSVHHNVWNAALNFKEGFTPRLDIAVAMNFRSPYAMRFYEFCLRWEDAGKLTKSLEEIREWLCLKDKYPIWQDLKDRVIDPAKKELDEKSPISFTYDTSGKKHKIRQRIVNVTFTFYKLRRNMTEEQEKNELISKYTMSVYRKEVKDWLRNKMNFTPYQLRKNAKNFYEFEMKFERREVDEMEETFNYIARLGKRPQDHVGLFMDNIKKKTANATKPTAEAKKVQSLVAGLADKLTSK